MPGPGVALQPQCATQLRLPSRRVQPGTEGDAPRMLCWDSILSTVTRVSRFVHSLINTFSCDHLRKLTAQRDYDYETRSLSCNAELAHSRICRFCNGFPPSAMTARCAAQVIRFYAARDIGAGVHFSTHVYLHRGWDYVIRQRASMDLFSLKNIYLHAVCINISLVFNQLPSESSSRLLCVT